MLPPTPISADGLLPARRKQLMEKAQELEAAFISEMLSYTGLGESSESFGGGVGEDQFASVLRAEQSRLMVERGGIGLAEMIFQSLIKADEAFHDA